MRGALRPLIFASKMNELFIYIERSEKNTMNPQKYLAACLAALGVLALTGCSHGQSLRLANERTFSLEDISDLTISYDEEAVTFYESMDDILVLREYMTEDKSSYYAKVDQSGDSIEISEGGKPLFHSSFSRRIEVYLPLSYRRDLTVTTTDGDINGSALDLSVSALRIDSTSGTIKLRDAKAQNIHLSTTSGALEADLLEGDAIRIETTSGTVSCQRLRGDVTYTTTSGDADIRSAAGSGSYQASNSGQLTVVYTDVTGDLSFFNKNGGIQLALPAGLEFLFEASAKNGSITTSFPECGSTEGGTVSAAVGAHPAVTVRAETKNGTIEVTQ